MKNFILSPRISVKSVNRYFEKCRNDGQEIHTLQIWQDEELLLRIAQEPYDCADKREIYSLSKTFCSTAIGCLCDEGLLSVEDRIVDIFPDKLPDTVSENLKKMKVRHVLSMNTGHDHCVMSSMFQTSDSVRAFLAQPVVYEPGTHFYYNTGASCLLAAIVQRKTGQSLLDYAKRKFMDAIGIQNVVWNQCLDGTTEGGCGLQASSDDIAALGRLYLQRGVWNGKRILSEEWIRTATCGHSDNSGGNTDTRTDWNCGYGYQIWLCKDGGYRGDGAFGQFMIVLPEKHMVVAVQAIVPDMQKELNCVLELVEHLLDKEDDISTPEIPGFLPWPSSDETVPFRNAYYMLETNIFGWKTMRLYMTGDQFTIEVSDGRQTQSLHAGKGKFACSEYRAKYRKPKLMYAMYPGNEETIRTAASYTVCSGVCRISSRHLSDPHTETVTVSETGGTVTVTFSVGELLCPEATRITGKRIPH